MIFQFVICFITRQLILAVCEELDYNYNDYNLIITAFSLCNLVGKKLNASLDLLTILSSPLSMFNNLQVKHFVFNNSFDIIWLSDRGW